MSQPFPIQRILDAVHIDLAVTESCSTPVVGPLLQGPERKYDWKYRMLTCMLGYLQGTSRQISISVLIDSYGYVEAASIAGPYFVGSPVTLTPPDRLPERHFCQRYTDTRNETTVF